MGSTAAEELEMETPITTKPANNPCLRGNM
jgi:hypothetical protein